MAMQLGVLDLSVVNEGRNSADALAATTALAAAADRSGYHRFWVAEHHNMDTVACTSPGVLIAHLAASTSRIRVGSGGVMLPNHAPLAIAEQFAMLEALHPGRIDLGIGRAPGTDQRTAQVLRGTAGRLGADTFPTDLLDLMALLGDRRDLHGGTGTLADSFRATPEASTYPQIFLLGSSDYSARLAAALGLPFGFAHHFDMGGTVQAAALYHELFTPSAVCAEPHLLVTANVLCADSQEEADWHAAPGRITALRRRSGRFVRLPSPADALADDAYGEAARMPSGRLVGTAEPVVAGLRTLAERTSATEVMVTSVAFDTAARVRSLELVAQHWAA